ncbi:MAG: carbonic anhydrase [Alphaproteobacteria bacterium]
MGFKKSVLIGAGLVAFAIASPAVAAGGKAHWAYEGATGPKAWGKLDKSYRACGAGVQQSPIDLQHDIGAKVPALSLHWKPVQLGWVVNNGHTIQVNTPKAGYMTLGGARYDLLQFHFHQKSEHKIGGKQYPMEVHFVHKAAKGGGLAVIGVMLAEGAANSVLASIWKMLPQHEGEMLNEASVDLKGLLPKSAASFRYSGSLTTPPCTEIVSWTVMKAPVSLSSGQIKAFGHLFSNNFRPIQPQNRRYILSGG